VFRFDTLQGFRGPRPDVPQPLTVSDFTQSLGALGQGGELLDRNDAHVR
jgi:hypothetical protein